MRFAIAITTAATLGLAACGGAADDNATGAAVNRARAGESLPPPPAAPTAAGYVAASSAGDLYEIESSRLAIDKSDSAELRGLAQVIVADHRRAAAALATAAREADPPRATAAEMNAGQQRRIAALRAASGTAFDRLYLRQQVDAHGQALSDTLLYAHRGDDPALRRHAATRIAPIQTHLARARTLASRQSLN